MAQEVCLFKDAVHVCGEPSIGTVAVTVGDHSGNVPACQRHRDLLESSVKASALVAEVQAPPTIAESAQEQPAETKPAA